jgi:hypothetical protein
MSNLWVTPEELGDFAETEFAYEAAKSASNLLWALSGRKYSGTTTVTERYVCAGRTYRYGPAIDNNKAILVDGDVYNFFSDDLDFYEDMTSDGMTSTSRIRLRGRPVTKIHTIRDRVGNIISPDKYYLVDHSTIQAVVGVPWSACNVEVTYSYGVEPPTMGKMAARTLAIEFAKLFNGDDTCALPQRVTSISRQGVSYTLLDSQDFIDEMRTGLYAVDLFLKSVNPDKANAKARVFSTDVPRARRSAPKSMKLGASALDIVVPAGGTGTTNVSLDSINGLFLLSGGWSPEVIIRNYGETASKTLTGAAVTSDPTTSARTVTNKSLSSNVATITTSTDHGFYVDTEVVIAGVDATFNGTYTITQVPTPTTFRYAKTASNVSSVAASGTATSTTDDRITISVTYADALEVLKMIDPGTYELYGTRTVGGTTETSLICTGNLKIGLASSVINAYTIGS